MNEISLQAWLREQLAEKAAAQFGADDYTVDIPSHRITSPTKTIVIKTPNERLNTVTLELV